MTELLAAIIYLGLLALAIVFFYAAGKLKKRAQAAAGKPNAVWLEFLTVLVSLAGGGSYAATFLLWGRGTYAPIILFIATFVGISLWDTIFQKGWFKM